MKAEFQNQEHAASYYAATINENISYPVLKGGHQADICIVGGGFTGVATALGLAERGYKVALLEANRIGWGASGRNGGQIIGGFSGSSKIIERYGSQVADMVWAMRWRGQEIIFERADKYNIDCDLKMGYIDVASKRRQFRELEQEYTDLQARHFPYELQLLDKSETQEALGTQAYVGGLINMRNGHLHPLNLCLGEAKAAANLGTRIFEQSMVTGIKHGPRPRVETAEGYIEADTVIMAGNVYHELEQQRLSGTTFHASSFIIATEPLSESLRQQINPQDLAVCEMNNIIDYYRYSAQGHMLYGGRCNYTGHTPSDIKASVLPRLLKVYPQLNDVSIDYQWGGNIGVVVRRIPMVGRIDKNIFFAQGYSGHGVNVTHLMGEILTEAVGGTMERFDLFEKMPQIRVPGGNLFGNQLVALGMLYYRLKDLL
jgi:gamma-glutamylputrescine oxidase